MTTHIENHFVKPLTEFYGRCPFGKGLALRLEPYAKTLTPEYLELIATRLIETGGKTFPSFSACKTAIENADQAMRNPQGTALRPWEYQQRDKFDWEKRRKAFELCRCEIGKQADEGRWLPALLDFCEANGRLPQMHEINAVKAKARRAEEGIEAARGGPLYRSLIDWRGAMLARAHKDVFGFQEAQAQGQ